MGGVVVMGAHMLLLLLLLLLLFQVSLLWSIFGFLAFAASAIVAWRQHGRLRGPFEGAPKETAKRTPLPPQGTGEDGDGAPSLSEGEVEGGPPHMERGPHAASTGSNTL